MWVLLSHHWNVVSFTTIFSAWQLNYCNFFIWNSLWRWLSFLIWEMVSNHGALRALNLQNSVLSKIMPPKFQKCYWLFPPGSFCCTKSGSGVMPMCSCHVLDCSHQSIRHQIAIYWFVSLLVYKLYEKRNHLCFIVSVLSTLPGAPELFWYVNKEWFTSPVFYKDEQIQWNSFHFWFLWLLWFLHNIVFETSLLPTILLIIFPSKYVTCLIKYFKVDLTIVSQKFLGKNVWHMSQIVVKE